MWDAHTIGAAHQAPLDRKMQPKYADEVEETGYVDSGKFHWGDLQSNRRGLIIVF